MPQKRANVGRLIPVVAVLDGVEPRDYDDAAAQPDDIYWAWFVYQPFTWARFLEWWIARRWIVPREEWKA